MNRWKIKSIKEISVKEKDKYVEKLKEKYNECLDALEKAKESLDKDTILAISVNLLTIISGIGVVSAGCLQGFKRNPFLYKLGGNIGIASMLGFGVSLSVSIIADIKAKQAETNEALADIIRHDVVRLVKKTQRGLRAITGKYRGRD